MGRSEFDGSDEVTHGICPPCSDEVIKAAKRLRSDCGEANPTSPLSPLNPMLTATSAAIPMNAASW